MGIVRRLCLRVMGRCFEGWWLGLCSLFFSCIERTSEVSLGRDYDDFAVGTNNISAKIHLMITCYLSKLDSYSLPWVPVTSLRELT